VQVTDRLVGRRFEIYEEFSALCDFIWKTPRFIEGEWDREREKLAVYYPDGGDEEEKATNAQLRGIRAYTEAVNLAIRFPRFMAQSNLFMAASAFECHLLNICKDLEERTGAPLGNLKGQGVSKFFRYLKSHGYDLPKLRLYEQVDAILTLRNALFHAAGNLELCREALKVRQIVGSLTFIEPTRRHHGGFVDEDGRSEAIVVDGCLFINNYLPFRSSAYFRDFLLALGVDVYGVNHGD
jgi:hypothetical protein